MCHKQKLVEMFTRNINKTYHCTKQKNKVNPCGEGYVEKDILPCYKNQWDLYNSIGVGALIKWLLFWNQILSCDLNSIENKQTKETYVVNKSKIGTTSVTMYEI